MKRPSRREREAAHKAQAALQYANDRYLESSLRATAAAREFRAACAAKKHSERYLLTVLQERKELGAKA